MPVTWSGSSCYRRERRNARKPTNRENIKIHIKITADNLERDKTQIKHALGESVSTTKFVSELFVWNNERRDDALSV